jgi:hypothetical protein
MATLEKGKKEKGKKTKAHYIPVMCAMCIRETLKNTWENRKLNNSSFPLLALMETHKPWI